MAPPSRRLQRIDALRGIAVFGILLVNVWSFVYGAATPRYGVFGAGAGALDHALIFLVAAFAEQKFYPIFAFLFGAGFAMQTGGPRQPGPVLQNIQARYKRRINWLLVCGLAHGMLLWYGDILTSYALTAFWLAGKAGRRLRVLVGSWRGVLAVNVAVQIAMAMAVLAVRAMDSADIEAELAAGRHAFSVYTSGGWGEIAAARIADFCYNLLGGVLFFPRIALLFMAGVFAVRLGWLTRPEHHRALWRKVLAVALVAGLPINLWWGYVMVQASLHPLAPAPLAWLALFLIDLAGPCLAAGYVAALMLVREPLLAALASVFAPVGRIALSNYLMQTLICGVLLQGFGLGLGALLSHAQLVLLCVAIMGVQLLWSRWWLARHQQGPVEALWRRYTA